MQRSTAEQSTGITIVIKLAILNAQWLNKTILVKTYRDVHVSHYPVIFK